MTEIPSALSGGFGAPSIDAARAFRSVLKAMSRPGLHVPLHAALVPPRPLSREAAALLLTLTDADTPVWLAHDLNGDAVRPWLAFHTGSPIATDPAKAMFAVAGKVSDQGYIRSLALGTAEYPDRAATLILDLPSLGEAPGLALTGPGIETEETLDPDSLPDGIVAMLMRNAELYPLGVDVILTAPAAVVGLPRSTHVVPKEAC